MSVRQKQPLTAASAIQLSTAKKQTAKTTYYIARKPTDLPLSVNNRQISDIDYSNLPKRVDAAVKADVNRIIAPGLTASERDARKLKTGISGAVSCLKNCIKYQA
jgi:hypothetical protein